MKMFVSIIATVVAMAAMAAGHSRYSGECPAFTPMEGFEWDKFAEGRWYAMEKFNTKQSKCLTYEFVDDEFGKKVEQTSQLKFARNVLGVDNTLKYTGRLAAPYSANPAKMEVRFELNVLGKASYVVLETDYDTSALVCTCQAKNFLLWTFHRRSCTILQREPIPDPKLSSDIRGRLNEAFKDEDDAFDHDFDRVDHRNCEYSAKSKGVTIDVGKIIGGTKEDITGVVADVIEAVDDLNAGVFGKDDKEDREKLEENINLPLKDKNPTV